MKYVDDIELDMIGKAIAVKQINFRESICKPCQELYDNGYIDTLKPIIFGTPGYADPINILRRIGTNFLETFCERSDEVRDTCKTDTLQFHIAIE